MEWHNPLPFLLIALLTKTKDILTYLERNPTNVSSFMHCNSTLGLPPAIMWDLSRWVSAQHWQVMQRELMEKDGRDDFSVLSQYMKQWLLPPVPWKTITSHRVWIFLN